MRRKCLCAALAVSCVINVSLAQVRLQGKVVDESNEPIPGANIRVSESLNGTTTDAGGKFELNPSTFWNSWLNSLSSSTINI